MRFFPQVAVKKETGRKITSYFLYILVNFYGGFHCYESSCMVTNGISLRVDTKQFVVNLPVINFMTPNITGLYYRKLSDSLVTKTQYWFPLKNIPAVLLMVCL